MAENNSTSGGIGLAGCVFIVFLILKLTEVGVVAKWSWWWVTCPLWIPILLAIAILIVILFGWLAVLLYRKTLGKKSYAEHLRRKEEKDALRPSWQKKLEEIRNKNR